MITAKPLTSTQYLVLEDGTKLGTLTKEKKGWLFFRKGSHFRFRDIAEIKEKFNIPKFEEVKSSTPKKNTQSTHIYGFPCGTSPYEPIYDIKKQLPIYSKSSKSKSLYCAGYYAIQFKKGWVKSFNPKLITLERYPYKGPFKTEQELKSELLNIK